MQMISAKAKPLLITRIVLAATIVICVSVVVHGFYVLRMAERVQAAAVDKRLATDEKVLALLRSRGMSPATYKAALNVAERAVGIQKFAFELIISNAHVQCVSGAGVLLLSVIGLLVLRKLN